MTRERARRDLWNPLQFRPFDMLAGAPQSLFSRPARQKGTSHELQGDVFCLEERFPMLLWFKCPNTTFHGFLLRPSGCTQKAGKESRDLGTRNGLPFFITGVGVGERGA